LLISDDQDAVLNQDVLALTISGEGIPEPATVALMTLGLGTLGVLRRHRRG
jgi:hypothetical protein